MKIPGSYYESPMCATDSRTNKNITKRYKLIWNHSTTCYFCHSSMQVYCPSIFILRSSTDKEIEKCIWGFLWCQGEMKRGQAKVSGDFFAFQSNMVVCVSKVIQIKALRTCRSIFGVSIQTKILCGLDSLLSFTRGDLWDVPLKYNLRWGWRKLLHIRELGKH